MSSDTEKPHPSCSEDFGGVGAGSMVMVVSERSVLTERFSVVTQRNAVSLTVFQVLKMV